jgi:hypothetical protein
MYMMLKIVSYGLAFALAAAGINAGAAVQASLSKNVPVEDLGDSLGISSDVARESSVTVHRWIENGTTLFIVSTLQGTVLSAVEFGNDSSTILTTGTRVLDLNAQSERMEGDRAKGTVICDGCTTTIIYQDANVTVIMVTASDGTVSFVYIRKMSAK